MGRRALLADLAAHPRERARLRSCGGPTAGHIFTTRAIGSDDILAFDDDAHVRRGQVAPWYGADARPGTQMQALPVLYYKHSRHRHN